jgi:hypothetical protein
MVVGSTIKWETVKGVVSGIVESVKGDYGIARLANGKCVLVNQSSIIDDGKEKD